MSLPESSSELTLVAPTTLTYTLTNDNPSNTEFIISSTSDLNPSYSVCTEITASKTITKVTDAAAECIATLEWRELLSDKVTFLDKPAVSLNTWMKSGLFPNSDVSFEDDDGRRYYWKNVAAGLDMELYAKDTPGGPIAAFRKSRSILTTNTFIPATFVMAARAQEIGHLCVVSFLFLEKRRRTRENSSLNRARMVGLASFSR